MTSVADLADIVIAARRGGAKVIVAGDQQQLPAVEGGGGMSLLAAELGYVQLTTAVRFTQTWEQEASLALRSGQESAITAYDEHGRITGGEPDDMMEAARRAYVSHYLDGTDVLLIASDRARCRELSRRIRDDLIHLGRVDDSRAVRLAEDARAGTGDLIICRRNNNQVHDQRGPDPRQRRHPADRGHPPGRDSDRPAPRRPEARRRISTGPPAPSPTATTRPPSSPTPPPPTPPRARPPPSGSSSSPARKTGPGCIPP